MTTNGVTKFNDGIQVYNSIGVGGTKDTEAPIKLTVDEDSLAINKDIKITYADGKTIKFSDIAKFFDGADGDDFADRIKALERKTQYIEDPGEADGE